MDQSSIEHKLTVILSADVAGYSRLMGEDEEATLLTLKSYRQVLDGIIADHRGRIFGSAGDSVIAEFPSTIEVLRCALEIQQQLDKLNAELPDERRMQFRIGINLGDVMVEGDNLYGDGVNIAARVEGLAEPGGICISRPVYEQVKRKLDLGYVYMGERKVKNIAEPIAVYRVQLVPVETAAAKPEATDKLPEVPSIVVLPFANMSADPEQEYFADGITEDLITALAKISRLFVIARNSSFTYKGRAVDVKRVSRELDVHYVLEGSVRKAGNRVRITAQLIDATTGGHLWADRYDRDLSDIFALQDEITTNVVTALQVTLVEGEQARVWRRSTESLEAWDCLTQALVQFRHFSIGRNVTARRLLERAVGFDPDYATAWVWLAWTYWSEVRFLWTASPDAALTKAGELVEKALALDDSLSETHSLLGAIHLMKGDHDQAVAEGERAVALEPNGADVTALLAMTLNWAGRPAEALALVDKAVRLSPMYSAWYLAVRAHGQRLCGRLDESIDTYKSSIARNPDHIGPHIGLTISYVECGREQDAKAEAATLLKLFPKFSLARYGGALTYSDPAQTERALDALRTAGLPE
ncbi:MAG: adenylate/guanylate cyclase domain-containing protein [Proteobacteria bacterium]|nr:adenylate/guanylate cyclase domain-containing protein [Pseudomonadota bacterium]